MLILQSKTYTNLFADVFITKYNFIKKKKLNSDLFLELKVKNRLLQLFSVFFSWVFSEKTFHIKKQQIISQYREFVVAFRSKNLINFFYILLIKAYLPRNNLNERVESFKNLSYSFKEKFQLSDSIFFNLLLSVFAKGSITLEDSTFKSKCVFYKINQCKKEKFFRLVFSFFNKD